MVNWNPNYPEVLGNEWLATVGQQSRVNAGQPARMQRLISTTTEEIQSLELSAAVNPLVDASIPTLIDIIEEGNEYTALPKLARLAPTADVTNDGWVTETGSGTNVFNSINEASNHWPGPAQFTWIQTTTPFTVYSCSIGGAGTIFGVGGAAAGGRIAWVEVGSILGANTGFRKLSLHLEIGGVLYMPAGGNLRSVHGYGAITTFWFGEINPATGNPWTPADIADFAPGGTSRIRVQSWDAATSTYYPKVFALSLNVYYHEAENREAVAVWRRPEDMSSRLNNIETDALLTVPSGAAGWSKDTTKNYLFYWRQSVSPSEYGAIVADDVQWNGLYQNLGPRGLPPNVAYPLHPSGTQPPPSTVMASDWTRHDQFGRPQAAFTGFTHAAFGLVLKRTLDGAPSVDSQPYRLDLTDLEFVQSTQSIGQQVTMPSTQSYVGVRVPIVPPTSGNPTLTVSTHRVSDGVQMGGSFSISADAVRRMPAGPGGLRYVSGLITGASMDLSVGVAYEIRLSSTPNTQAWIAIVPDASLGPEASFGGTTDGVWIGSTHHPERTLLINLIKEPDAPGAFTAATQAYPIVMPDESSRDVEFIDLTWTAPAVPLGASFVRYELERQIEGETNWTRVANITDAAVLSFTDHLAPRELSSTYRIRQVASDGRISDWATSSPVTPAQGDYDIILTSNHAPEMTVLLDSDPEASYEFLSSAQDEVIALHGANYQVVFSEHEDRGVGWRAGVELNFGDAPPVVKAGQRVFTPLLEITRSRDIPYVVAMDFQGTRILGHVTPSDATQSQPGHVYKAALNIIPTHDEEIPVEVDA